MELYVSLSPAGDLATLKSRIARLDDLGVKGVFVSDHLFVTVSRDRAAAYRGDDPFVVLAAIAALSPRLVLGTLVANVGLLHPALVFRHFAQLASLVGGERVLAGIGAGWNTEEFEALGLAMPSHGTRLDRLEESCRLARALFDRGMASIDGAQVIARELPLAPKPSTPPRLMLGGGSDRLLEIAGTYADFVDLNGSSRRQRLRRVRPLRDDFARRAATTVDDLVDSAQQIRVAAKAAGRPSPQLSVLVNTIAIDGTADPAAGECPYVLAGEAARLRDTLAERAERIGLDAIIVAENADLERLRAEVLR
jgi:alkanesulfonate monooxygenase SsuD/methylene tetrahydromethanopterin reductase-like flavin-dependent oxidoreductase (luciferase family)